MRNRSKLLLTGLTATVVLSLAIGSASANRLSISNRNVRTTWASLQIEPGAVRCPVTLEGSFHSQTISKVSGVLMGHISRAFVSNPNCTGGHATVLQETLPWHDTYCGFEGALPNITGLCIDLTNMAFNLEIPLFGISCLWRTSVATPARFFARVGAGGAITSVRANERSAIPLTGGCALLGNVSLAGEGRMFLLGTTNSVFLRLI